jgi:hypothetical protein
MLIVMSLWASAPVKAASITVLGLLRALSL